MKSHPPLISNKTLQEGFFDYVKHPIPGRCPVKYCTNPSAKDRAVCNKCKSRKIRSKNPQKDAYRNLKSHAKQRGIKFTITFQEFMEVAKDFPFSIHRTSFISKAKDKRGHHLTIDRIDINKGYEPGNIQALTLSENIFKQHRLDYSPEGQHFKDLAERQAEEESEEDVPF